MKGAQKILRFLIDASRRGEQTALVTITGVIGSSSRAPGTHLGVSETGAFCGSISGGCVEAAVVGLAKDTLFAQAARKVRLGAGSPYIDIRLPCGGGLDLLITPNPDISLLARAWGSLDRRESVGLWMREDGQLEIDQRPPCLARTTGDSFYVRHDPDLRLVIVGHGAEPAALTKLALAYGAVVDVFTPDPMIADATRHLGAKSRVLLSRSEPLHLVGDDHTAIVMLFHDHDWEAALLAQALNLRAFYIGAMGSRRTHTRRLEALRALGVPADQSRRIAGPAGSIPSARDPETLALSILSQVVEMHKAARTLYPEQIEAAARTG